MQNNIIKDILKKFFFKVENGKIGLSYNGLSENCYLYFTIKHDWDKLNYEDIPVY